MVLTGDVPLMIFLNRFKHGPANAVTGADVQQKAIFIGLGLANFVAWQIGVLLGVVLASFVPSDWGLALVASLTLLILIVKMVDNWPALAGCVASSLTAVFLHGLPNKLWVLLRLWLVWRWPCLPKSSAEIVAETWPKRIHERETLEDT